MSETGCCPRCGAAREIANEQFTTWECKSWQMANSFLFHRTDKCEQADTPKVEPCGGCGETCPEKRCVGCAHQFTAADAPQTVVNPYARNVLSCIPGDSRTLPIDVYSIGKAYPMEDAVFHAVKKCILAGLRRGDKDYSTDIREAMQSLQRELDDVAKGSS
jgi:hypothetical protein